jgi:hypothetical protein
MRLLPFPLEDRPRRLVSPNQEPQFALFPLSQTPLALPNSPAVITLLALLLRLPECRVGLRAVGMDRRVDRRLRLHSEGKRNSDHRTGRNLEDSGDRIVRSLVRGLILTHWRHLDRVGRRSDHRAERMKGQDGLRLGRVLIADRRVRDVHRGSNRRRGGR